MFEVGDLVRFRGPTGIVGQILDVDAFESCAAITYRVLLLTGNPGTVLGAIIPYVDEPEIERYE